MRRTRSRAIGQKALFEHREERSGAAIDAQLLASGLPLPEKEFLFAAPLRAWRFDYAWPPWLIAFEVEGGGFGRLIVVERGYERRKGHSIPIKPGTRIRVGGRHNTGEGLQADCEKYNRAAVLGWLVIRATTTMVRDGVALEALKAAFAARGRLE